MQLDKRYNNIYSNNFILEIIRGNVPGHGFIRKFFRNPSTALNTDEDMWDYAATEDTYTYTADTGADYYIFSSNATDNQLVQLNLLDSNFRVRIEYITLNGKTPVKVATRKHTRVYRMFNALGSPFAGNIFCTEGDGVTDGAPDDTADVRAYISIGNEQTQMCHFTIPNEMHGLLLGFEGSVVKKQAAAVDVNAFARLPGSSFRIQEYIGLNTTGTSYATKIYATPILVPPRTDLKVRCNASVATVGVTGGYELIVCENQYVSNEENRIIL